MKYTDGIEVGGVMIRNLVKVPSNETGPGYSFEFEARVNGEWRKCNHPCGNWSYVEGGDPFSVPIGWWALDRLWRRKGREEVE